jgi:hypothetical protein
LECPQLLVHKFAYSSEFEGGLRDVAEADAGVGLKREHGHARAVVIIIAGGAVHGVFKPRRSLKGEWKKEWVGVFARGGWCGVTASTQCFAVRG